MLHVPQASFSLLQLRCIYIYIYWGEIHAVAHYAFSYILYYFVPHKPEHSPQRPFVEPTKIFT
jgi:hypothetical protein